jgi:hypothetical protein
MIEPEFDKEGYPTDLTLEIIKDWSRGSGYVDLMTYVHKAWKWDDYISCKSIENQLGHDVLEYTLITGGWSGNESIIYALKCNLIFYSFCWRESHRGGKHIFEVRNL